MEGNHLVGLFQLVQADRRPGDRPYIALYYTLPQLVGQGHFTLLKEYKTIAAAEAAAAKLNKEVRE